MRGMCNSEKVVNQANTFLMENSKEEKAYSGISAGNWKQRVYIDTLFQTLYLETKQPHQSGLEFER